MREAYRRRKWAVPPAIDIEQCRRDEAAQIASEQLNEGCKIYGHLEVNKVSDIKN